MTDFRIKCVTHDQVGACKDEITPAASSTSCEPVVNASTQVPGWQVNVQTSAPSGSLIPQTQFAQICNEIHLSFTLTFTEMGNQSPSYVTTLFSYSLVPPAGVTISSIVPFYQGAGQFQGTFLNIFTGTSLGVLNGRITAELNSVTGIMRIYVDSWIVENTLIQANTNFVMEGSLVFYIA